jgi:glutathione synthase/RimK-type ligase-like ATP-grasp enzyme
MKTIGMKSGSIDLIVDENNDYIFLEVNPIGQFAQVSIPCNYYIEEYIANYLINEKN